MTEEAIREVLAGIYGDNAMVRALSEHIHGKIPIWSEEEEGPASGLHYRIHMAVWDFFPGGGTAEIAADRIMLLED